MRRTITALPDTPQPTGTPDGQGWAQAWAQIAGLSLSGKREPYQTIVGKIAQTSLLNLPYALVLATMPLIVVFSTTHNSAVRIAVTTFVGAALVSFVSLRVGWCLGCDQGELDRAGTIAFRLQATAASGRREARRRFAFSLPRQPHGEGYLYVIAFSTGYVKVGQTEDPKTRLATHRSKAAAFGVHITNYWISPSHMNFKANETRLINACLKVSTRSRKEYFHTVGYSRAVQFANSLTYYSDNTEQTSVAGEWA